ncbi:MAG: ABC transporter permease [Prevotellaceae bacterium]|jgi:ABC-type lipoprotein release transport system permease subunit|nr:ABC transporter permease [Prevotellaceae bacterium]
MRLALFIARRYLFAKKSHNVINIISMISVVGIAVGTLALVVVLSVYNGFDDLVKSLHTTFDPDLRITPAKGKVFSPHTAAFDELRTLPEVASFCEIIEENVLLQYCDKQDIVTLKGVDSLFEATTPVRNAVHIGEFSLHTGEIEQAVLGSAVAAKLRVGIYFLDPLEVYIPKRAGSINILSPAEALNRGVLYPAGIFSIEQIFDNKYVFVPLAFMRRLLSYTDEVSAVEIRLQAGINEQQMMKRVQQLLGDEFVVKDRYLQNESVYLMMMSEKAMIYAILLFIVIIISCNVLGSLAMLIIEKKDDVTTLKSMGANDSLIRQIFLLEGWMISLLGVVCGIVSGLFLCYLQQCFGLLTVPDSLLVDTYPVRILWSDVLLVALSVSAIGFVAALLPARYLGKR